MNIELLQCIGVRQNVSRVAKAGHIKTAVKVVADRSYKVVRATIDINNLLWIAQYIRACAVLDAWREGEQIIYVASDNGEIVDLGVINYAAEARCGDWMRLGASVTVMVSVVLPSDRVTLLVSLSLRLSVILVCE